MYCVYCGERVNVQATFCPRCGKPFRREATPVAVECLSCHARNPDDAVYCWQCGRLLKREEAVLPFILPGAIAGPGQAAGTVPTVQGTPQMGGVPSLPGTPQTSGGLAAGSAPPAGNVSGGVAGSGNFAAGAGGPDNLPGGVTGPHAGNFSGGLAPSTGAPVGNLSGGVAPFIPRIQTHSKGRCRDHQALGHRLNHFTPATGMVRGDNTSSIARQNRRNTRKQLTPLGYPVQSLRYSSGYQQNWCSLLSWLWSSEVDSVQRWFSHGLTLRALLPGQRRLTR